MKSIILITAILLSVISAKTVNANADLGKELGTLHFGNDKANE